MSARRITIGAGLAAMATIGACLEPQPPRNRQSAEYIYEVVCGYPLNMWQSYDKAGDLNPEGFAFVMYLLSSTTGKGVHTDGCIRVSMYEINRGPEGISGRILAHEWLADTADLRERTPTSCGYGYDVYLHWGDLDVFGREVEIVVRYEAPDGRVVQSQTKPTRVPARKV